MDHQEVRTAVQMDHQEVQVWAAQVETSGANGSSGCRIKWNISKWCQDHQEVAGQVVKSSAQMDQ
jgi:hypothetical protein